MYSQVENIRFIGSHHHHTHTSSPHTLIIIFLNLTFGMDSNGKVGTLKIQQNR